jgi:hypothetical protein
MPDWALRCSSTTSSAGFWRGFGAAPSSWLQADAKPSHYCHILSNELLQCHYHMLRMRDSPPGAAAAGRDDGPAAADAAAAAAAAAGVPA